MNKYIAKFTALCPNNSKVVDEYTIIIKTKNMIEVEEIIKYLKSLQNKSVFQEKLTKKIAKHFNAKVKLIGWHFNIKVVCKYD